MRRYEVMSAVTEGDGSSDAETHAEPMTARRFMTQKSILSFFALIMIPAFLCYMYLEYFFPLYAERNGLTTSVVGIVFSLYGLFIVYFGPSMSTLTEKMFGVKRATSLASILTGVSLLAFALTGSLMGAILAVFILAVSDSFGESVYTTYFLALKESQQIGKSIAAGYLEFSSQIGKMLGTLAFGIALGFGEKLGIGIIGLVTLGFGLLFLLFEKPHQKKSHGEV
jgi:predicted MFS family arabinose efflux permease